MSKKTALTDQAIAALALGVTAGSTNAVEATASETGESTEPIQAGTEAAGNEVNPELTETNKETDVSANVSAVTVMLQSQLSDANESLALAKAENINLTQQLQALQESTKGLMNIAAKACNNMRVALGGSSLSMDNLTAAQVVSTYDDLQIQFNSAFKAGGVSVASTEDNQTPAQDHMRQARVQAAGKRK